MRDEFVCVEPERGKYVEIVQDADVCMRTYIFCFFEMAWDDLKRIILQRIERCCYATVFGECTICSYFWILFSGYLCIASEPNGYSSLSRFHQMYDDDGSSRLALRCLAFLKQISLPFPSLPFPSFYSPFIQRLDPFLCTLKTPLFTLYTLEP